MTELGPILLPRSAFSPRETARAGDVWRAFQDVAVHGSIAAGWPPERYRREGVSFVVRSMIVVHHREAIYGEPLTGRTWPSRFRRGMFFSRECRIAAPRGPIASCTQEWVHVSAALELAKASDALVASFPVEEREPPIVFPAYEPIASERVHRFELECWHTWMDPLAHVNHPAYVDWCDEAISRAMRERGLDPVALYPVAEQALFKNGIVAGERACVETRLIGDASGAAVHEHQVSVAGRPRARLVTVRRLAHEQDEGSALLDL